MKSMTGYGRGESAQSGFKITVEVSSVNRKQTEITVYLPRDLETLESRVRDEINRKVGRGRITVKIILHAGEDRAGAAVRINAALAKAFAREMTRLGQELKLKDAVTLDMVLRAPGVLETGEEISDSEAFWSAIRKALDHALAEMIAMRRREGEHLEKDLRRRVVTMRRCVERVKKSAPKMVQRYREQLQLRIKNADLPLPAAEDERLIKEVVYFADRSDISEELTRLISHFNQFDEYLKSEAPVGRTLDFLAQEINREVNTIGAKAADSTIAHEVVTLKAELEKFREQVQNVE